MNPNKSTIFSLVTLFVVINASSQTNTCSGSYTFSATSCQEIIVGNGTPGSIQICLTTNNVPAANCIPGNGCTNINGNQAARVVVYESNSSGTGRVGASLVNWTSTSGTPCFTLNTTNGYAVIVGACNISGTTISWSTIDACGNNACDPSTPPCVIPCSSCSNACGSCGFPAGSTPTVAQVTANCPSYAFTPPLLTGQTATRCHQFVADGTTADFRIVLTAACAAGGNVTNF